ncbi:MAG: PKD domain-containing protein [Thermoplasmatales archaeon]|nr:MAG: PKD domain-containing protein [Thermoplasmatales archaeon]
MHRKILVFGIILLFVGTGFIPTINKHFAKSMRNTGTNLIIKGTIKSNSLNRGTTFYVGGSGPGNYTSIQDAIDNASDGDTIFIYSYSSPYYENIDVYNSIQLIGEDKDNTIIDGDENEDVIELYTNTVSINNLGIKNSGLGNAGIKITSSSNNTITNCNIYNNSNYGITLTSSINNTITNCNISNNGNYGILLDASTTNSIICCTIYNHTFGIELYSSSGNNTFYHNTILNNNLNAYDPSSNIWDNNYPSGGNYWSDYSGLDNYSGPNQNIPGPDHIGDTPYNISGSNNQDRYPLMASFGPPHAHFTYIINNKTVFFNASLSFDYDGTIDWYEWDFGDGNTAIKQNSTITYSYANYGLYNVTLVVIDNDSKIDSLVKTILADSDPPIIEDNTADEATAGSPFTVNATVTDNVSEVSEVWVEYWYDDGEHYNFNMENIASHYWEKTIVINLTSNILHYILSAVDDPGNWAYTNLKNVTITPNTPPNIPNDPDPYHGETDVDINADLNWNGGDVDLSDTVTYDVHFGLTSPPPFKETIGPFPANQTSISYAIESLNYGAKYYWKVTARDSHGASTEGPIWNFTTITTEKIIVEITKPEEKAFYLQDKFRFKLPRNVIIVGPINITADVTAVGEIDRVEFYINDKNKNIDTEAPYTYYWKPLISFRAPPISFNHTIKVVAYDSEGNHDSDEILIWKWRIHPVLILFGSLILLRFLISLFSRRR